MHLIFAVTAALLAPATAWWCNGHMMVATVAQMFVSQSTFQKMNTLSNYYGTFYPNTPEFVSSACWADDLKAEGVDVYNQWHFINLPVVRGPVEFAIPAVYPDSNAPWTIAHSLSIIQSNESNTIQKAEFLRFLIHMVGDAHQPLHLMSMYSDQFPPPIGDMGGNLYLIDFTAEINNLHFFFDSGADQFVPDLVRPLNSTGFQWLDTWAKTIIVEFPITDFTNELEVTDPQQWILDIFKATFEQVYDTPFNQTMSPTYIANVSVLLRRQIALGGYRLAQLLDAALVNVTIPAL